MDYQAYLQSETWQAKRLAVLDYWSYSCALCCSRKNVEVHHRTYERIGCERITDLIALCDTCHQWRHQQMQRRGPEPLQAVLARLQAQYKAKRTTP